jgi:diamine N-acetyltransferase
VRRVAHATIDVTRATAADAALLADIGARTFRDTYSPDNKASDIELYLAGWFSPDIQASELAEPGTTYLIARADGVAVGYTRLRAAPAPECIVGSRPLEIVRFYADRPWIGHGVGSALMGAALTFAEDEGCDTVWLDVWTKNPRAIAFYEKWDFVAVGRQEYLLGEDVQDDLLMSRASSKR